MATVAPYKHYKRNERRAVLETDFSHGMMASNSIVDEGYVKSLVNFTYEKDNGSLIPRPALRPYQIIMPDVDADMSDYPVWLSDSLAIKDVKECIEDGVAYYQIIVGALDEEDKGFLCIITVEKNNAVSTIEIDDTYTYDMRYGSSYYTPVEEQVLYYSSNVPQIHDIFLIDDHSKRMEFPVGAFAYGNSYYFFIKYEEGGDTVTKLCRTVFSKNTLPHKYVYEEVTPKTLSVSEAVTYGYNMLLKDEAYTFQNQHSAANVQLEGILPYESDASHSHSKLVMTPRKGQQVDLVCYYNVPNGGTYNIIWETRETTASDWTELKKESVTFSANTFLCLDGFFAQDKEIMVRVTAQNPQTEIIEKAIVVGFDFSVANYGAASTLDQKVYDLSTATGMEVWNNRIVLWGLPADPTILFISDYNEPSYFPYPNNIVVFDEPIIYAIEFMDSLCVFTTNKLYQVSRADDGNSWTSTVLQSHLSINPWDKHLVQTVRNMLYFKSGNYYYMMVPKAQSQTGELTLAPITNPITNFFDNFSVNVQKILEETYGYTGEHELLSYYNFLDYEDIHNLYLYKFNDTSALLHFDIIYNTVDRTWKIWTYEAAQILFPFKHNATETGLLATISSIIAYEEGGDETESRIIQLFTWDKNSVRGGYIPPMTRILYDPNNDSATVDHETIILPGPIATVVDGVVVIGDDYGEAYDRLVVIIGADGYYSGFSVTSIVDALVDVYVRGDEYFTFKNYQFIDTGYREDELQSKKRYREIQLLIDNLDQKDMQFGMDYMLDGAPYRIYYKYDVSYAIDEFDPEYGVIYIDSVPYLEVNLDDIDNTNQWTIDQELYPETAFWKVRVAVAGKGTAPRLKLYSRNEKRFGLLSLNWVSRLMYMR